MSHLVTWTEVMRVAQHMSQRSLSATDKTLGRAFYEAADLLESEAKRLQAEEWKAAQEPARGA